MPLWDNPPHSGTLYTSVNTADSAGGHATTYTASQASVPCSISLASAATKELFAQQGVEVNFTVAVLSSALTAAVKRGDKFVASDGFSHHIEGIRPGLAYGNVPAFTYLDTRALT